MPFTPAHPAVILPLLRRGHWVSAALVTGSIAPDLPTYLPLGLTHEQTHPLTAILWPDGLLALGALLVWWGPLRPALMSLWPGAAARCGPPGWRDPQIWRSRGTAARWLGWLVLSELVGLASHLLWDGFTHRDGYFAEHWSVLNRAVDGHPIFNLLQFWCSVVGIVIVAAYLVVQWRRRIAPTRGATRSQPAHLDRRLRYAVIGAVVLATVATVLLVGHTRPHPYAFRRAWLWRHRLVDGGGVLLTLLALWAIGHALAQAALRTRSAQTGAAAEEDPHTKQPVDVP